MSFQGTQEGQYKMSVSLTSCNLLWIHWPTTAKLSRGQMAQIIVRKMSERKSNKWTRLAFSACKQKLPIFIPYCLTFLQNIKEFGNTLKITDFFFLCRHRNRACTTFPTCTKKKKNPVGYKVLSGQNSHKLHKYSWNKYILPISFSERFKAWCRTVTTCRKKFFSKKAMKHLSVNEKIYTKTFFTLIWKEIRHHWDRITNGIRGQYT